MSKQMKYYETTTDTLICKLTVEMDMYLHYRYSKKPYTYIYNEIDNQDVLAIRIPGLTVGYIRIDSNNIIEEIGIASDLEGTSRNPYKEEEVNKIFENYIGVKLIKGNIEDLIKGDNNNE